MCDIQNNGKIQREFETRSTDDQPTIQWLPVVGSWTFLGVNMHFNEKLFMCDSCNFLVKAYQYRVSYVQLCTSAMYMYPPEVARQSQNPVRTRPSTSCQRLWLEASTAQPRLEATAATSTVLLRPSWGPFIYYVISIRQSVQP